VASAGSATLPIELFDKTVLIVSLAGYGPPYPEKQHISPLCMDHSMHGESPHLFHLKRLLYYAIYFLHIRNNLFMFRIPNGRFMNNTKEYILKTALKLFLKNNFKEVTMKEIVDKTGLSKGAFYHYFPSKEQLFVEVINRILEFQINFDFKKYAEGSFYDFYHACANNSNPLREIGLFEEKNDGNSLFNFNYFSLIFDAINLIPGFKAKITEFSQKEVHEWALAIKKAKESGEIKSTMSDEQIAMLFITSANGMAFSIIIDGKYEDLKNELLSIWDSFYNILKGV